MALNNLQLQFTAEDIVENTGDVFGVSAVQGLAGLTILLTVLGIIIGFIAVIVMVYRLHKEDTEYAGKGEPYDKMKIVRMDGEEVIVNLSKNQTFFTDYNFKQLLEHELINVQEKERIELRKSLEELKKMVKDEEFFIYDAKIVRMVRAIGYGVRRYSGKAIIISPVHLLDDNFSWWDRRGLITLSSFPRKQKVRKVIAHYMSTRDVVRTIEGHRKNVWLIIPVPKHGLQKEEGVEVGFKKYFKPGMANFVLKTLENVRDIAQAGVLMEVYAESHKQIQGFKAKITHLEKMIEELSADGVAVAVERDIAKLENLQVELVGESSKQKVKERANDAMWLIISGIAAIVGYELPSEFRYLEEMPPFMSAFILILIVVVVYAATKKPDKKTQRIEKARKTSAQEI